MPFGKATIKNASAYVDNALYADSPPQAILQDINMARMVGVLHQLGHLATHATTLFEDLYDEARKTKERLDHLSSRVAAVAADVAPTEDLVYATRDPVTRFGGVEGRSEGLGGARMTATATYQAAQLTSNTRDAVLGELYAKAERPPNVQLLDEYRPASWPAGRPGGRR